MSVTTRAQDVTLIGIDEVGGLDLSMAVGKWKWKREMGLGTHGFGRVV